MFRKGALVRVWRKQNSGERKPAEAQHKTRYPRKQNLCARKKNVSTGISISFFGARIQDI